MASRAPRGMVGDQMLPEVHLPRRRTVRKARSLTGRHQRQALGAGPRPSADPDDRGLIAHASRYGASTQSTAAPVTKRARTAATTRSSSHRCGSPTSRSYPAVVETPCTWLSRTTANKACFARRRGWSNHGKYVPGRTFVPTRASRRPRARPIPTPPIDCRSVVPSRADQVRDLGPIRACDHSTGIHSQARPRLLFLVQENLPTKGDRSIPGFGHRHRPSVCAPLPEPTERWTMARVTRVPAGVYRISTTSGDSNLTPRRVLIAFHTHMHGRRSIVAGCAHS